MSKSSETSLEPNLTPILDMVFQLITFFMLVINFKGGALDLSLELPVLGSARPLDTNGVEGRAGHQSRFRGASSSSTAT